MKKKLLSLALVLAMVLTLLPAAALAAEDEEYTVTFGKLEVTETDGKLSITLPVTVKQPTAQTPSTGSDNQNSKNQNSKNTEVNSAPASQSAGIDLFADAKTAGQLLKITFWITKPDKTSATKDGKFNSSSGKFHIRVASKAVTPSITSATFTVNGASISGYKFPLEQASSAQKVEIYYAPARPIPPRVPFPL